MCILTFNGIDRHVEYTKRSRPCWQLDKNFLPSLLQKWAASPISRISSTSGKLLEACTRPVMPTLIHMAPIGARCRNGALNLLTKSPFLTRLERGWSAWPRATLPPRSSGSKKISSYHKIYTGSGWSCPTGLLSFLLSRKLNLLLCNHKSTAGSGDDATRSQLGQVT